MTEHLQSSTRHELPEAGTYMLGGAALAHAVDVPHLYVKYPELYPGVEAMANFQGNWAVAQTDRMAQPSFEHKLTAMVENSLPGLKDGTPGPFDKPSQFKQFQLDRLRDFEVNGDRVLSQVGYAPAAASGNYPAQVGSSGYGEIPTVFTDAVTREGTPLTDRQKDIIAAHEAYHSMVNVPETAKDLVLGGFDTELYLSDIVPSEGITRVGYMLKPDELMARMAQLKNYFGMRADDPFTKEHMEYARGHYVADTGLDNSMSTMFRMVSPRNEEQFLHLMNTLPV